MKTMIKRKESSIFLTLSNNKNFSFDDYSLAKKVLKRVLLIENINKNVSVNILVVSSYKIKCMNEKYRGIDKATDVLSFPNLELKKPGNLDEILESNKSLAYDYTSKSYFLGDIVICYDKLISQSKKYGHSVKREFAFLITHSMLHLIGYDHIKSKDEQRMINKQKQILDDLKIYR